MSDENDRQNEGMQDDINETSRKTANTADQAAQIARQVQQAQRAREIGSAVVGAGAGAAAAGAAEGAAENAAAAAAGAAGDAAVSAAEGAGAAAEAGGTAAAEAGGAVSGPAGWIALAVKSVLKVLTDENTRQKVIMSGIAWALLSSFLLILISGTRNGISLDPLERGTYSAIETDYADYPSQEEAMEQAIAAINAGIAASYNRTQKNIDDDLNKSNLHKDESVADSDYAEIEMIQYNPYKLLAAYQVIHGRQDYSPEKLQSLLANADLFPYQFSTTKKKTHQNLYKTNNTPVASINGLAHDEPIEVPAYTISIDPDTGKPTRIKYDWNAIAAGQDWFVVSDNGDTVTIGAPEDVDYVTILITRFDEKAALKAIGYDDDIIGDDLIEPDYDLKIDDRIRATAATYFENYRELWLQAEQMYGNERSSISTDLKGGEYTVEANITEDDKQALIEYCQDIADTFDKASELEGSIEQQLREIISTFKNSLRPYVLKIKRFKPKKTEMLANKQKAEELKNKIQSWKTSEDPNVETVTAAELQDAIDLLYDLRSTAYYVVIRKSQQSKIFECTRKAINILDGEHLMSLDTYTDPNTGALVIADYGEQANASYSVSGAMSEAERLLRQKLVDAAFGYLGTPYGTGIGQIDCSKLAQSVYRKILGSAASNMPRTAVEQGRYCEKLSVTINQGSLRPGDLVFYSYKKSDGTWVRPERYKHISHVAIYIGDGKVVEASSKKGKVVYRTNTISSGIIFGAPLYALADLKSEKKISELPVNIKSMDTYGVLDKSDAVEATPVTQATVNVRYFCGCAKCGYGINSAGTAAMSKAAATTFLQTSDTDQTANDPLGTVFAIDGVLYKCRTYSVNEYEPDGNTVLLYVSTHQEAVQKNYDKEQKIITVYRNGTQIQ